MSQANPTSQANPEIEDAQDDTDALDTVEASGVDEASSVDEAPDGAVMIDISHLARREDLDAKAGSRDAVVETTSTSEEADDASPAGGRDVEIDLGALEAILFSTHHPLTAGKVAEAMGLSSTRPIRRGVAELNKAYESTGRSFRVEQVAGGYQLLTLPEYGATVRKLVEKESDAKLTRPAIETLAIIAYKQPVLRVDVESIRGVACGETIRTLMEKRLVKIAGRAEMPGRPILYGTTKRFLEVFGLADLNDLPKPESEGVGKLPDAGAQPKEG